MTTKRGIALGKSTSVVRRRNNRALLLLSMPMSLAQYHATVIVDVYFVALARLTDGLIVASYCHAPEVAATKDDMLRTIRKMTSNPVQETLNVTTKLHAVERPLYKAHSKQTHIVGRFG